MSKMKKQKIDYDGITDKERAKALETTLKQIEKDFGKGSVMKFGEKRVDNVPFIPTGSLSLDMALGIGGVARGRIIEIFGPESSGKTTLALHIVAEAQKAGGVAAYIDAEHALDPIYASAIGVDIDEMYISQPDDGEQALEITEAMVRSGAIDIVVIDSVAALVPRAEIEGEMGASHMGLQARLMSQALRKITAIVSKTNCAVVFINQLRANINTGFGGGPTETTPGGRALKFYASMRLDIRRIQTLRQGDEFIGNRTRVRVVKNKLAPPFKQAEFDIMYGEGISKEGDLLDLAADIDVITKSGSWYSYGETRMGQGRETAKQFLIDNPEISFEVENAVRTHHEMGEVEATDEVLEILEEQELEEQELEEQDGDTEEVDEEMVDIEIVDE